MTLELIINQLNFCQNRKAVGSGKFSRKYCNSILFSFPTHPTVIQLTAINATNKVGSWV